jgi:YVTN family beta-propeller protein
VNRLIPLVVSDTVATRAPKEITMVNAFMTSTSTAPTPAYTANAIDTSNDTVLYPANISLAPAGTNPTGVAITPDGLYAIIISQGSAGSFGSGLTVISTVTNNVIQSGSLSGPTGYAQCVATGIVGSSSYAYITYAYFNATNDAVIPLDVTNAPPYTVPSTSSYIDLGASQLDPYGVAVTPDGHYVYVLNQDNSAPVHGSVSIITTSTNSVSTPYKFNTGANSNSPVGVAVTPDNSTVYVTLNETSAVNGQVAYFAVGATVSATPTYITVGVGAAGIAITPNVPGPQTAYVANTNDNTVSYFSTTSPSPALVSDPSYTFNLPFGVAITPDGTKVYVGNRGNNTISVISTSSKTVTNVISYPGGDALGVFIQQNLNQDTTFAQGVTSSWFGT